MESVLPQLFFLSFFAPLILRVALGAVLLYDARGLSRSQKENKVFALGWLILGLAILAGFLTQAAAIVAILHIGYLYLKNKESVFKNPIVSVLAIAILLTLLITGPGGLAFDLPY